MQAQTTIRRTADDPGKRSRVGPVKIIIGAVILALLLMGATEVWVRSKSEITFRGNEYHAQGGCQEISKGEQLTTIGSILGHSISGPSSVDRPAAIYVKCLPVGGYKKYEITTS